MGVRGLKKVEIRSASPCGAHGRGPMGRRRSKRREEKREEGGGRRGSTYIIHSCPMGVRGLKQKVEIGWSHCVGLVEGGPEQ
jgi:hypothetical protein